MYLKIFAAPSRSTRLAQTNLRRRHPIRPAVDPVLLQRLSTVDAGPAPQSGRPCVYSSQSRHRPLSRRLEHLRREHGAVQRPDLPDIQAHLILAG